MRTVTRITALAAIAAVALSGAVAVPAHAASATATITGRVYSDKGTPIVAVTVSAGARSTTTDHTGKFVVRGLKAGTYALKFSDPRRHRYLTEYLGDSATLAAAATITVSAGEKHTGVSERLTHAALVSGVVTVDGKSANPELGAITVELTDVAGRVVARDAIADSTFALTEVPAGTYTLTAEPTGAAYPRVMPVSRRVILTSGQQLDDQRLDLQLVRGVVQASAVAASVTHVGSRVKFTVRVASYMSVAGGVVSLKYHGEEHHAVTVGSNGTATITISTASWKSGSQARVDVLFDGPIGVAASKKVTRFTVR